MTEQFLEDYFNGLASASSDIANSVATPAFYRMSDAMNLDEFDNAVRNMKSNVCLLLEIGEGDMGTWDTMMDRPRIGLHLLIKTTEKFADINTARDQAKGILLKIIARIRYDCKNEYDRDDNQDGPLRTESVVFDSKVKWGNMTAIDGNWYGKSFYFDFSSAMENIYNPDDFGNINGKN